MSIYATGDGRLVTQTDYHPASDAPFAADAALHQGCVQAVGDVPDPTCHPSVDVDSSKAPGRCTELPGRS